MGEPSSSEATLQSECSLLREWLSVAGLDKTKIRDIAADAFTEQIHARFDSAKLDEDAAQLQAEPVWLRAMIGDARWRPLLYDICAANPSSVLLQAAVRALAQSEHAAEVQANASLDAVIGGASSMQTFLSSLAVHLNSLRQGQPGAQARLEGLTCVGEPDFLVAQMLLRAPAIASDPEILRMLKAPLTLEAHRGAEARTPLLAWAEQAGRTPGLEEDALEVADALSAES